MPDCHMLSDSSTFHTVNPREKTIERQKVAGWGQSKNETEKRLGKMQIYYIYID